MDSAVGNIRHTQRSITVEHALDGEIPLDAVRVLFGELIRSLESLRPQLYIERTPILNIRELEEPRRAEVSVCIRRLKAIMDSSNGVEHRPQGRNRVNANAASYHGLVVRKWPIGKTEARRNISVSLAQAFRPMGLFGC